MTKSLPPATKRLESVQLRRLLWRSYMRTALIPLFVIEVGFLATYWVSETVVYRKNVEAVSELSHQYFNDIARREAATISASLEAIASHTRVFAHEARTALDGNFVPPAAERARYRMPPEGGLYTTFDNGTTASFYAGSSPLSKAQIDKVWRLSALDPFMIAVKKSNDNIASIYFNTFDSYNRIYPYVDAGSQYTQDMVIPEYNFYYEADAKNNPERRDVWTDAYVDPAGHGWMVSSIAPVWRGDKLEGVVGIDVTLQTIIDTLLDLDLPWNGYAILVDQNGGIIALPPAGEHDFGLDELTDYDYSQAILSDTHKPENFNLNLRADTKALAEAMKRETEGDVELDLGGARLASFSTVPQTGWRLVIIAPTDAIFAHATALHDRLELVGYAMLGSLFAFYLLFFGFLTQRARRMSRMIDRPLTEITGLIDEMSNSRREPHFGGSEVQELDRLGHHLVATRQKLLAAEDEVRRQSRIARIALAELREANTEMVNFTRLMSHEIRTPLSIIDGSAQIIHRKADTLSPVELRTRADRLRETVATVANMLTKLLARFDAIGEKTPAALDEVAVDPWAEVCALAETTFHPEQLRLHEPVECPAVTGGLDTLIVALKDVLEHVAKHAPADSPVELALECEPEKLTVVMTVTGDGAHDLTPVANRVEETGATVEVTCSNGVICINISVSTTTDAAYSLD